MNNATIFSIFRADIPQKIKNMFFPLTYNDGSGTRNLGLGFRKCHLEMGLRQVEPGFSSFLVKSLAYLMIFQSGLGRRSWLLRHFSNNQIWQKFGKKWRKAWFNLPSTHFSKVLRVPETRVLATCSHHYNLGNRRSTVLYYFDTDNSDQTAKFIVLLFAVYF